MGNWTAEVVSEQVVAIQENKQTGEKKAIRVTKRRVFLTAPGGRAGLAFGVGRGANGRPVFTDEREAFTGAAPLTLRGPLPGERYTKPGPVRKLTPTAWSAEVARLIGAGRAAEVVAELS